jgi:Zn-dependent oligopeptidase
LSGVGGLGEEETLQIKEMNARRSELQTILNRNIASVDGIVNCNLEELDGLSESQIAELDFNNETGLYSLNTRAGSQWRTVMEYATNRSVRERVVISFGSRVRDLNADPIHELVTLRQKTAELLGYNTWADSRLVTQMAGNLDTAYGFTKDLGDRLYPLFLEDMQRLVDLNNELEGTDVHTLENFQQADYFYLLAAYLEKVSGVDQEEAAKYFEESATIRALFDIYEQLFGITISIEEVENKWADDVQLAKIYDAEDGSIIAAVYLDLHPRANKYTHYAFLGFVQGRVRPDGNYQAPVGMIIGNWPGPTTEQPSLWSFDEVNIMFHEFGREYMHNHYSCF